MFETDGSRVWDPGENNIIEIDDVTRSSTCQDIVASTEDEDSTYFERTGLDPHANMVVLGKN